MQETTGNAPAGLEVHAGTGDVVGLPDDGGAAALAAMSEIVAHATASEEPYSPVGWTKCGDCGFHEVCWRKAEEDRDVALVSGVDQNLAVALRQIGVNTIEDLLGRFTEPQLAAFRRPWGNGTQKVGKRAGSILLMAEAMATGKEIRIAPPNLPDHANWIMFDLEGMPPQLDETDKIYLWGMQVFGRKPGPYLGATAGFGPEGDREGWTRFLENAKAIFAEYGDIPFVHWHHYERVHLDEYVTRFGDPEGHRGTSPSQPAGPPARHAGVGRSAAVQLQPEGRREVRRLQADAGGVRRRLVDGKVHRGHRASGRGPTRRPDGPDPDLQRGGPEGDMGGVAVAEGEVRWHPFTGTAEKPLFAGVSNVFSARADRLP